MGWEAVLRLDCWVSACTWLYIAYNIHIRYYHMSAAASEAWYTVQIKIVELSPCKLLYVLGLPQVSSQQLLQIRTEALEKCRYECALGWAGVFLLICLYA